MAAFTESGMQFEIPDENLFCIEKSNFFIGKKNLSTVEFLCFNEEKLCFVEAKSSFPKAANIEDFNKNLNAIARKFFCSFELFLSHFVGVNPLIEEETQERFLNHDFSKGIPIRFVLIINCSKINPGAIEGMTNTIQNSFLNIFKAHKSIWNIKFIALDHAMAMEKGFIKSFDNS